VVVWAVGQPAAVRAELGLGLDITIFVVTLSPPAYPGYAYITEMSPATTPMVVPQRRYRVMRKKMPPRADEGTGCWPPPGAPTLLWYWPSHSPLVQKDLKDGDQVARAESAVSYFPMEMVLWRRRVYHGESTFSLEIRWHPKTGEIIRTEHPRTLPFKAADKYRATAFKLLQKVEGRGRRKGPAGFDDDQDFEDTLLLLIQEVHAKNMDPTQDRIATLLQPVLARRWRDTGSPASVDIDIESTKRLIRKHSQRPWHALVKKALQST